MKYKKVLLYLYLKLNRKSLSKLNIEKDYKNVANFFDKKFS